MFTQLVATLPLLAVTLLTVPDTSFSDEDRSAAANWAAEHREEVFDAVMPAATSATVQMPTCRITTLRVPGSLDSFDYAVRLIESCPTVDERGTLTKGPITGEFLVAKGSPISDQLARLRLRRPAITTEDAAADMRIDRVVLTPRTAAMLLGELSQAFISPMPPIDIALDSSRYEVASATGVTTRAIELTLASTSRGERRIMALAQKTAAANGFDEKRLRFDASYWD